MASESQRIGRVSELTVEKALLSRGWEISRPILDEKYDLLARRPGAESTDFKRIQIKTIRRRKDRNFDLVVYATNGRGEPYLNENVDYIAGVYGNSVYLIPCDNQLEYWAASETIAERKWEKIDSTIFVRESDRLV